jgi:hypothetical protein
MRGDKQDVVERQRFPDDTHAGFSYAQKWIIPVADALIGARPGGGAGTFELTCPGGWITLPMS